MPWPNWFGLDHNDLAMTKINWLGPNMIHFGRKSQFGPDQFILVVTISFWLRPNHYGQVQINLVRPKPFWTDQNCFGHKEGQGIRAYCPNIYILWHRPADRIDGNNKLWQVMWSRYEISTDNEFRPPNGMSAAMRVRDKKKMSALRQLGQRPLDSLLLVSSKFVLDQELVITFFERQKHRRYR